MWQALLLSGLATALVAQKPSPTPMMPPPPVAPPESPLVVTFTLSPVLAEPGTAPKLVVQARNTTSKPLPFMRFDSAKCFAHYLLKLSLTGPAGPVAVDTTCPVLSWPGVKGTLAPDATEKRTLELRELFPATKWGAGRYQLEAEWEPAELEPVFGGAYAWRARQTSLNTSSFTRAKPVGRGRAVKGKELSFPDGARFTLAGHGHKDVMAGEESPLIVSGRFAPSPKAPLAEFSFNVFTSESALLPIDDHTFLVGDYSYDEWMDVTYFGRLPER